MKKLSEYLSEEVIKKVLIQSDEFQNNVLEIIKKIESGEVTEIRFQTPNDNLDYVKTCWETWECPSHPVVNNMSRTAMIREIVLFLLKHNDHNYSVRMRS